MRGPRLLTAGGRDTFFSRFSCSALVAFASFESLGVVVFVRRGGILRWRLTEKCSCGLFAHLLPSFPGSIKQSLPWECRHKVVFLFADWKELTPPRICSRSDDVRSRSQGPPPARSGMRRWELACEKGENMKSELGVAMRSE